MRVRQDRHRTLPIPQVVPGPEGQADDQPGVQSPRQRTQPLDTKTGHKSPLRTPVYDRSQNEHGIYGQMVFDPHSKRALTIPTPIRSSLAQAIAVYRSQISHYISRVKPFGMAPGYPTAHVLSLINQAPRNMSGRPTPTAGPNIRGPYAGATANRGKQTPYFMGAARRFSKALPTAINNYEPPTY